MDLVHSAGKFDEIVSTEVAYQQVQEWLRNIYGDNNIPDYEVNAKTVNVLHKMMSSYSSSNTSAKELLEHQNQLSEFYSSEGDKIHESLKFAGIEHGNLSKLCQLAVKSLAMSACYLDLKSPSTTNFLLGLNDLSRQQMDIAKERRALLHLISSLSKKLASAVMINQQLQRDLKTTKDVAKTQELQERKRAGQIEFLQGKQGEYNYTIKNLEDCLVSSGATPDIHHKELVKKSDEIKLLEAKLNEVTAKLKSFQNLPPNENLARLKIEESKKELLQLEEELQMKIA